MLTTITRNPLILLFIAIAVTPLLLINTTVSMIHVWKVNETFTHGFLVFPITFWLIWQKKDQLRLLKVSPEPWVLALFIVLLFGWFISSVVDVQVVQQLSMISIVVTTVWIVAGRQILLSVLFPLMFLFFAVPFGQSFIPPLMEFTANFTVHLVQLSGIPIYRDGLMFTLPSGSWSVVEECSGVRYLIASITMGSIYAYINYASLKKRLIFVLLSLIVPVIGNGLRAYGIVMIGHFSGMELAVGADHLVYGWVFFGVVIISLFYFGSFWRDPKEAFVTETINSENGKQEYSTRFSLLLLIACFALIACFYSFSNYIKESKQDITRPVSFNLPANFTGWQLDADRLLKWQPIFFNPDAEVAGGYFSGNDFVQLNIGYYQTQRQGAEAVSSMNRIATPLGGEWKKVTSSEFNDNDMNYTETELSNSNTKVLVWHWYRIGQYQTTSPYIAKALDAYNLIVKGRTDASMISVSTLLEDNKKLSRQRIIDFLHNAATGINHQLEQLASE